MTITGQNATLSWAAQDAKIGQGGTFTEGDYTWHRHKALTAAVEPGQIQQNFPLEVGGVIIPTGAFKSARFGSANFQMIARLENVFGWILHGLMGDVSTIADQPASGVNQHIFRLLSTNHAYQPWMAVRCELPGTPADGSEDWAVSLFDAKIAGISIEIPAQGKPVANVAMQARDWDLQLDPTWSYSGAFEDDQSAPDAHRGSLVVNGSGFTNEALSIVSATINLAPQLTSPAQEQIIGDPTPEDFVRLSFVPSIEFVHKYNKSDLRQAVLTDSPSGTTWSESPYYLETSGQNYAIDLYIQSPGIVTGSTPYGLRFRCNRAAIQKVGTSTVAGGTIVMDRYMATIQEPVSGDPFQLILENAVANYTWPTP